MRGGMIESSGGHGWRAELRMNALVAGAVNLIRCLEEGTNDVRAVLLQPAGSRA